MKVVRTVRGDINPSEMGPTDSHEHLFFVTPLQPGDEFQDVDLAIEEARTLVRAGARTVVDWTPLDLGRDPEGLLRVCEATGLQVVAATGVHREAHYGADHPLRSQSPEGLVRRLVTDIEGPGVRSGVIKIGASYHRLQPFEEKAFAAAAEAHRLTRVPLCVHTEHGTMGLDIVEHLGRLGVAPASVILAHLDRNPDAGEHAETGASGAWLQLDGPGRTKYWPDSTVLQLISDLADRGLAGQLLVGGDTGRRSMMRAYGGGPGLDYVFARFKPRLERELGAELSRLVFVENPARAFAFNPSPPAAAGPGRLVSDFRGYRSVTRPVTSSQARSTREPPGPSPSSGPSALSRAGSAVTGPGRLVRHGHEAIERATGVAVVDCRGGNLEAVGEVVGKAGHDETRRGVQADQVAPRSGFAVQQSQPQLGIVGGIPAGQFGERGAL
jgi:phosphotriesterase-related protein